MSSRPRDANMANHARQYYTLVQVQKTEKTENPLSLASVIVEARFPFRIACTRTLKDSKICTCTLPAMHSFRKKCFGKEPKSQRLSDSKNARSSANYCSGCFLLSVEALAPVPEKRGKMIRSWSWTEETRSVWICKGPSCQTCDCQRGPVGSMATDKPGHASR